MSAKLNAKEKLWKLVEISQQEGSSISERIVLENLLRLVDGDLSHIGDGILEGRVVLIGGCEMERMRFGSEAKGYSLAPVTEKVCGVEVELFLESDVLPLGEVVGFEVARSKGLAGFRVTGPCTYSAISGMLNRFLFKTKEDAEAVAKAMNRFMEKGC